MLLLISDQGRSYPHVVRVHDRHDDLHDDHFDDAHHDVHRDGLVNEISWDVDWMDREPLLPHDELLHWIIWEVIGRIMDFELVYEAKTFLKKCLVLNEFPF